MDKLMDEKRCVCCSIQTSAIAGNPALWPISLCIDAQYQATNGRVVTWCSGCVHNKLSLLGSQRSAEAEPDCPLCKGTGQVDRVSFVDGSKSIKHSCNVCKGSGKLAAPQQGVPLEPTDGMFEVGEAELERTKHLAPDLQIFAIWRAMLAAAKEPK